MLNILDEFAGLFLSLTDKNVFEIRKKIQDKTQKSKCFISIFILYFNIQP